MPGSHTDAKADPSMASGSHFHSNADGHGSHDSKHHHVSSHQAASDLLNVTGVHSAVLDSYTATHNPPPYQEFASRRFASSTSTISDGTSSHNHINRTTDSGSAQSGHTTQPATFISRYIVFQVDREATVDRLKKQELPGVETLVHAVNAMPMKDYIGYIENWQQVFDDPEVFQVNLLRHGRPRDEDEKGLTKDMCIAVEPNKDIPHGRQPLHIKRPLPPGWGSCYHSSFDSFFVRIPELPVDTGLYEISQEEAFRRSDTMSQDFQRRNAHLHNYRVTHGTIPHEASSHAPKVTFWNHNDEAILVIRVRHDLNDVQKVPDPADLMHQQRDLVSKKKTLMSRRTN